MKIIAKHTGLGNQVIFLQVYKELPDIFYTDSLPLAELGGLGYTENYHRANYVLFGYNWRTFWRTRIKDIKGHYYGFKYKFLGKFTGFGLTKALLYSENISEYENLRRLFGLKTAEYAKKENTVAFIIGRKPEKSYPYWHRLRELFKDYEVRIFDRNIDAPGYVDTPTINDLRRELLICDYYIAEDTGVAHLADYLGLPGLVIFGGTSIIKNAPLNGNIVYKDVDCRPCYEVFDYKKPSKCKHFKCLDIEPIEVYNKFKTLMK